MWWRARDARAEFHNVSKRRTVSKRETTKNLPAFQDLSGSSSSFAPKNDKNFKFTHETLAVISVFPVLTTTNSISFPLSRTDELVHAKLKIACSGFIELLRFDIDRAS